MALDPNTRRTPTRTRRLRGAAATRPVALPQTNIAVQHELAAPAVQPETLRLSDVVAALSVALDITEGQPAGHALRTCVLGMRIGEAFQLDDRSRSDLFYALLLKDLGGSSNAAKIHHLFGADDLQVKRAYKKVDLRGKRDGARFVLENAGSAAPLHRRAKHVVDMALGRGGGHAEMFRLRCERGGAIALQTGFSQGTADAIRAIEERVDGSGFPYGKAGDDIPLLARIASLAQTIEIFYREGGREAARAVVAERNGSWFDPRVVAAFEVAERHPEFWTSLSSDHLAGQVAALEPAERVRFVDDDLIDRLATAFARVIDAKSPWTYRHSERVRDLALGATAFVNGKHTFTPERRKRLARAALLHDIGKLGISNALLDRPRGLSDAEMAEVRRHTALGERILEQVRAFRDLTEEAHLVAFDRSLLIVADRFEALTADRPYRPGKSKDDALVLLNTEADDEPTSIAIAALERFLATPEAEPLLAPREFDPNGIVVVG